MFTEITGTGRECPVLETEGSESLVIEVKLFESLSGDPPLPIIGAGTLPDLAAFNSTADNEQAKRGDDSPDELIRLRLSLA